MQKTIFLKLLVALLCLWSASAWPAPPVNNTVSPCEDAAISNKPSCNIDSDSVNVPPKMPHERGVIVPPEVPAEGLPNQNQQRQNNQQPHQDPREPVVPAPDNHLKN
jgi:hypothetical protein